ncbi:MAG TPA: DUF4126 domain-containing protein [Anaerolineaceae bacterium]|nr:DUF4126 domain-containing protein [Anaerolineaceae bacterium]HOV06933.1 DUF4126 domain-containing protein [Anaerolineaceae bacterium]
MDIFNIFTAFGLSASAGLNAYIPLLTVALLAKFTNLIHLQEPWNLMTSWWVIGVLLVLTIVEILADMFPGVNHVNDVVQSFIRPTAGAIVFAAASSQVGDVNPILGLIAGLLVSGGVHAVKSLAVRPVVNATTAGLGNVPVSIGEQATSTVVSILSVLIPVLVAIFLVFVIALILWWSKRRKKRQKEVDFD